MSALRAMAKGLTERAIVWSGGAWLHRRRMSGRALIVAYHNIVPDDIAPMGDRPNHLPVSRFAQQLDLLMQTHDVVPLGDLLAPAHASRPRAAITFDDAYRGAVRLGVEQLTQRGLPATIFVAPWYLGGRTFWWDALGRESGLEPSLRERALYECAGKHDAVMQLADRGHTMQMSGDMCSATDVELLVAANQPGITLGSHTWSHPNLAKLGPAELAEELARPMAWLRERVANPLAWIAYPYGAFNDTVERAVEKAGYVAGLAIEGGWIARDVGNRYAIPRINIPPGLTAQGFALRASGLFC